MIGSGPFSSRYSFEFGAWSRDFGSYPRQTAEFVDSFRHVIETATEVGASARKVAPNVRKVLASSFPELCLSIGVIEELVKAAEIFADKSGWPEGWIGVRSAIKKGKAQFDESQSSKLERLSQRLRPGNLADMVRIYALSTGWGALDIAVIEEDEVQKHFEAQQKVFDQCINLGQQLTQDQEKFDSLLTEILTAVSQRPMRLGKASLKAANQLASAGAFL